MKTIALLLLLALVACGGGGSHDPMRVPDGIPVIVGGFANWTDVEPTPGHAFGVRNAQGQSLVQIDVTDASGTELFSDLVPPGGLWLDESGILPGFYLVRVHGIDGRTFARYFDYRADGWDACVISNGNWEL